MVLASARYSGARLACVGLTSSKRSLCGKISQGAGGQGEALARLKGYADHVSQRLPDRKAQDISIILHYTSHDDVGDSLEHLGVIWPDSLAEQADEPPPTTTTHMVPISLTQSLPTWLTDQRTTDERQANGFATWTFVLFTE